MSDRARDRDGITVTGVEVKNFRRLRVARVVFVPEKGLVRITGPNAQGKTSLLKALSVLGGGSEIHDGSLHEGTDKGEVRLKLSNGYVVERRLTAANPKGYLDVTGPDGGKYGQEKLNGWLGSRSFDPLAFFSLSPDRQRDVLFAIGTDPDLPKKLEEVRSEHTRVYEERTPVISQIRTLRKVEQPEGERPEPVEVSAEIQKMGEIQAEERKWQDMEAEAREANQRVQDLEERASRADAEIERLEAELKRLREQRDTIAAASRTATVRAAELSEKINDMPDFDERRTAVQARIEEAEAVNASLEPWKRWERAVAEVEELEVQQKALTDELGSLKQREAQLLEQAGIPVPGLSFGEDGEPLLEGRPLALASGRERIEVAVAVAMAADPDMRVCLLDEANDLDLDALERLDALAKEHDFQVWAVRIGLEGDGEVVVNDGEAWGRDDPEDAGVQDTEPAEEPTEDQPAAMAEGGDEADAPADEEDEAAVPADAPQPALEL